MNLTTPFKLRSAALALAFLAAASAAQAQVDVLGAAFSEARVSFATIKHKEKARRPALRVPEDVWGRILEAVKAKGRYVHEEAPIPSFFTLEEIVGDVKADHGAEYVGVAGSVDAAGLFQPEFAALNSEDWKIDPKDGNWHVDQWIFHTDLYGEVTSITRATIIETPAMTLISILSHAVPAGDPGAKAKFKALLARWSKGV